MVARHVVSRLYLCADSPVLRPPGRLFIQAMRLWFSQEREPVQMNEPVVLYLLLAFSFFLILSPIINIWRRRGDIFEPVFLLSVTFFMYFWLRCMYALIWGTPLLGNPPFPPDTIEAWNVTWLYLILAFVLFLSGY
jgi:hypothetical protein